MVCSDELAVPTLYKRVTVIRTVNILLVLFSMLISGKAGSKTTVRSCGVGVSVVQTEVDSVSSVYSKTEVLIDAW